MDERLNVFSPYENVPPWHENQLTRALLLLLRFSPMSHQAWMHLIAPDCNLYELPKADFATQRQRILASELNAAADGEEIPCISVWLAPDATPIDQEVRKSDRQQILDGIVTFDGQLVVVIENKIAATAVTDQPHQINVHGNSVVFRGKPRSVSWQSLLTVFSDLIERELISGSEGMLVSDFLEFVEQHFPSIGPYSTLPRCADNVFRLRRRLENILGKALNADSTRCGGWCDVAGTKKVSMARLALADDGSAACLLMYPGDTLGQSRDLYADAASVNDLLALRGSGWSITPNFHWGFMATGYAWATTPLSVREYCNYWAHNMANTREVSRAEWEGYWATLEEAQIVEAADKAEFDSIFTNTSRQKAHPRPGIRCEYRWSLKDAKHLDAGNKFVKLVRDRVNELLNALGAPPIHDA
jgi:hypothetical protein